MIRCAFCDRSRAGAAAMVDHLVFWHDLEPSAARRVVHHPERPIPVWLTPAVDERRGKLIQYRIPWDS